MKTVMRPRPSLLMTTRRQDSGISRPSVSASSSSTSFGFGRTRRRLEKRSTRTTACTCSSVSKAPGRKPRHNFISSSMSFPSNTTKSASAVSYLPRYVFYVYDRTYIMLFVRPNVHRSVQPVSGCDEHRKNHHNQSCAYALLPRDLSLPKGRPGDTKRAAQPSSVL